MDLQYLGGGSVCQLQYARVREYVSGTVELARAQIWIWFLLSDNGYGLWTEQSSGAVDTVHSTLYFFIDKKSEREFS